MAQISKIVKMAFGIAPGWIKDVEKNGQPAAAVVVSDPKEILKGVNYEGGDGWVDVQVRVETSLEAPFEAAMVCKLSQAMSGLIVGMKVNVRYDPKDKKRVLLVDDLMTLIGYRKNIAQQRAQAAGGSAFVQPGLAGGAAPAAQEDPMQKLQKLKAMLDAGLITAQEYEAKKAEILSKY